MKQIALIICIFIVILYLCLPQKDVVGHVTSDDFTIIEYDSCEYVIRSAYNRGFLAHKGNCKYCEKRKQIKAENNEYDK